MRALYVDDSRVPKLQNRTKTVFHIDKIFLKNLTSRGSKKGDYCGAGPPAKKCPADQAEK
jgi:hypothetical protein